MSGSCLQACCLQGWYRNRLSPVYCWEVIRRLLSCWVWWLARQLKDDVVLGRTLLDAPKRVMLSEMGMTAVSSDGDATTAHGNAPRCIYSSCSPKIGKNVYLHPYPAHRTWLWPGLPPNFPEHSSSIDEALLDIRLAHIILITQLTSPFIFSSVVLDAPHRSALPLSCLILPTMKRCCLGLSWLSRCCGQRTILWKKQPSAESFHLSIFVSELCCL